MTGYQSRPDKPPSAECRCGAILEPLWREPIQALQRAGAWLPPLDLCAACEGAEGLRRATRDQAALIARLKVESGMGPLHLKMTWDQFEARPTSPIDRARRACLAGRRGMFLWGAPGCGKTFVAATVLNEHIEATRTAGVFANVPKLMAVLRVALQSQPNRDHLARLRETPCLVLDDIGVEKPTDFVLEAIYGLVDDWTVNERFRFVVTSNLNPTELANRVGDRIVSRLVGLCDVIEMSGEDRRLRRPI